LSNLFPIIIIVGYGANFVSALSDTSLVLIQRWSSDTAEGVFAYMDDSRVGSAERQTPLHHPEAFFNALATNGLAINLEKCVFAVPSLEILGHMISAARRPPQPVMPSKLNFAHPLRTSNNSNFFSA
jgi:hypothetical protein